MRYNLGVEEAEDGCDGRRLGDPRTVQTVLAEFKREAIERLVRGEFTAAELNRERAARGAAAHSRIEADARAEADDDRDLRGRPG